MRFFDTHCHFDCPAFDPDREQVWASALALGVEKIVIPGVTPSQWSKARVTAEQIAGYYAVGLHPRWVPTYATACERDQVEPLDHLQSLLTSALAQCDGALVAVGECGLDKPYDLPLVTQLDYFRLQARIAAECGLPLMIHAVGYHAEILRVLKEVPNPQGGVVHAFSGSYEIAQQYWQAGYRLGVGGVITYPRANKTRKAVAAMPLEALVLETDAPDMPLSGYQGMRNSPEKIPQVARCLAELKALPLQEVVNICFDNSVRLFLPLATVAE